MGMMINRRRVCGGEKLPYFVDMGLPSGTLWATRNIDVTQPDGFAASPFQYECSYFSWGNIDGHNPISTSAFDYNWGTSNDGPYAQTPGSTLTTDIPVNDTYDAARANLGTPWRMPLAADFTELFNNINFVQADGETIIATSVKNKLVTVNNVVGIYLKSKINGNLLFFPCTGCGFSKKLDDYGSSGYYLSRSIQTSNTQHCKFMLFGSNSVIPSYTWYGRFRGFTCRPVQ